MTERCTHLAVAAGIGLALAVPGVLAEIDSTPVPEPPNGRPLHVVGTLVEGDLR